jgi:hypothetical protein
VPGLPRRSINAVSSRGARRREIEVSGTDRQSFPCDVVDHVEDAEAATTGKLIMDEVEGPARVGLRLDEDLCRCSDRATSRSPLAHRQAFLAVEPVYAVDPGRLAVAAEKRKLPLIAEPSPLIGEVAQLRLQG